MSYLLKNIVCSPLKGQSMSYITSDFGQRTFFNNKTKKYETGFHNGIDMTSGIYVVATAPGKVISVKTDVSGYSEVYPSGNFVTIDHGSNIKTSYCHLKQGSVKVKLNEQVSCGQVLGIKGSTGHVTGTHLHYGIRVNNVWVNPIDYLLGKKKLQSSVTEDTVYIVKKGDTLSSVAKKFNTTVNKLVSLNKIANPNLIYIGQKIILPGSNQVVKYIVKKGDTLSGIAKKFNTNWQKIYNENKNVIGNNPNLIVPGQELIIGG